jgi:hypothetical protein
MDLNYYFSLIFIGYFMAYVAGLVIVGLISIFPKRKVKKWA